MGIDFGEENVWMWDWMIGLVCLTAVAAYLAVCLYRQRGARWLLPLLLLAAASGVLLYLGAGTLALLLLAGSGFAMLHLGN